MSAADQFADCGVLVHDAHRLQFRRGIDRARDKVRQGSVYLHFAPSLLFQELVYLQFANGLEAYPFRANFPGIRMLDGIYVHQTSCLFTRLPDVLFYRIDTAVVDHLRPELFGLPLDKFVVPGKRTFEKVLLVLMAVLVRQTLAYVAYILRAMSFRNETDIQHDTVARAACLVAVRLLDAVVPFFFLSLRVVA